MSIDVLVVGGGPAGLAAALELRRRRFSVTVIEREAQAGGIPRHAVHTGFGLRDLHRVLKGPEYAARYVRRAQRAGVELRTGVSATGWTGPTTLALTGPDGRTEVSARAMLLATGCRERPRAARLVPGSRPLGVFTTGAVQQLVYLQHQRVGKRAVVVGAEHVSFSAVLTLAHAGVETVALVTEHARHQSFASFRWLTARRHDVPVLTGTRLSAIRGRRRVEAVELTEVATGAVRELACDTVVFTGDWIPDHELARQGGLAFDQASRAPLVDGALRTSVPGVFAAGNLVHAAEAADVAALGGRHAARAIVAYLKGAAWPATAPVPLHCEAPLLWASPGAIVPGTRAPRGRFVLRSGAFVDKAVLSVRQGTQELCRRRYRRLVPNRPVRLPASWTRKVALDGGPVLVGLAP